MTTYRNCKKYNWNIKKQRIKKLKLKEHSIKNRFLQNLANFYYHRFSKRAYEISGFISSETSLPSHLSNQGKSSDETSKRILSKFKKAEEKEYMNLDAQISKDVNTLMDHGNYGLISQAIDKVTSSPEIKKVLHENLKELQMVKINNEIYHKFGEENKKGDERPAKKQFLNNLAILSKETGSSNVILQFLNEEMKLPDFPQLEDMMAKITAKELQIIEMQAQIAKEKKDTVNYERTWKNHNEEMQKV